MRVCLLDMFRIPFLASRERQQKKKNKHKKAHQCVMSWWVYILSVLWSKITMVRGWILPCNHFFFGNWVLRKGLTALYIVCTSIKLNLSHKTLIYRRKKYVKSLYIQFFFFFFWYEYTTLKDRRQLFIGLWW